MKLNIIDPENKSMYMINIDNFLNSLASLTRNNIEFSIIAEQIRNSSPDNMVKINYYGRDYLVFLPEIPRLINNRVK